MSPSIEVEIVSLQEPFIGNKSTTTHSAFNVYLPQKLKNEARVLTSVKKDLVDKIIVDKRTDLVDHPYFSYVR